MSRARAVLLLVASLLLGWIRPWAGILPSLLPDLPLAAVVVIATERPIDEALLLAALAGACADLFSAAPLGAHALAAVLVAGLVGFVASRLNARSPVGRLALLLVAILAAGPISALVSRVVGVPLVAGELQFLRLLATASLGILSFVVFAPARARSRS